MNYFDEIYNIIEELRSNGFNKESKVLERTAELLTPKYLSQDYFIKLYRKLRASSNKSSEECWHTILEQFANDFKMNKSAALSSGGGTSDMMSKKEKELYEDIINKSKNGDSIGKAILEVLDTKKLNDKKILEETKEEDIGTLWGRAAKNISNLIKVADYLDRAKSHISSKLDVFIENNNIYSRLIEKSIEPLHVFAQQNMIPFFEELSDKKLGDIANSLAGVNEQQNKIKNVLPQVFAALHNAASAVKSYYQNNQNPELIKAADAMLQAMHIDSEDPEGQFGELIAPNKAYVYLFGGRGNKNPPTISYISQMVNSMRNVAKPFTSQLAKAMASDKNLHDSVSGHMTQVQYSKWSQNPEIQQRMQFERDSLNQQLQYGPKDQPGEHTPMYDDAIHIAPPSGSSSDLLPTPEKIQQIPKQYRPSSMPPQEVEVINEEFEDEPIADGQPILPESPTTLEDIRKTDGPPLSEDDKNWAATELGKKEVTIPVQETKNKIGHLKDAFWDQLNFISQNQASEKLKEVNEKPNQSYLMANQTMESVVNNPDSILTINKDVLSTVIAQLHTELSSPEFVTQLQEEPELLKEYDEFMQIIGRRLEHDRINNQNNG